MFLNLSLQDSEIIDLHFEINGRISDGAKDLNRGNRSQPSIFFSEHNLAYKKYRSCCKKLNLLHDGTLFYFFTFHISDSF